MVTFYFYLLLCIFSVKRRKCIKKTQIDVTSGIFNLWSVHSRHFIQKQSSRGALKIDVVKASEKYHKDCEILNKEICLFAVDNLKNDFWFIAHFLPTFVASQKLNKIQEIWYRWNITAVNGASLSGFSKHFFTTGKRLLKIQCKQILNY